MIDTHTHLNFKAFERDWREVADRAVKAQVTKMIVVGTDLETSQRAVELAQLHPALYAAIGIHPHHARQIDDKGLKLAVGINELKKLARKPRVVAIGEIGLDRHEYKVTRYQKIEDKKQEELMKTQRELFVSQLQLARELDKPVIFHSREVGEEVLNIVQEIYPKMIRGVFHCFGGSKKFLKKILDAGFYVGFDGDITYVPDRLRVAEMVPIERLLTETDSPYLSPLPYRGERNEPKRVKIIVQIQAKIRKMDFEEVEKQTTANAEKLFGFVG